MMTPAEVTELIEQTIETLPERMSGNEGTPYVAEMLRSIIITDRKSVIEALKVYLAFRVSPDLRQPQDALPESRIWMALGIMEILNLVELKPQVESLLADVRDGKVLLPIHEKGISRYKDKLEASSKMR